MTFSSQSRHGLSFVLENSFGVTPPEPQMQGVRHTGCDLALSKQTIESDEIRDDRQIGHYLHGRQSVAGDIDFELAYGAYDGFLEAVLCGNWDGNVLRTGTAETSFTVERAFADISQYQQFTGCYLNQMDLTVQPDSLIGGRFGVLGKEMSLSTSPLDAAVDPPISAAPMDSFSAVLKEDGAVLAQIAGIDFKIDNGFEAAFALGSETAAALTAGRSRVSGEITAYFEDQQLVAKFLNKTRSSLEIAIGGAGGGYEILLPNILYNGADMPVKAERAVILALPFVALFDESAATNIKITRIPTA